MWPPNICIGNGVSVQKKNILEISPGRKKYRKHCFRFPSCHWAVCRVNWWWGIEGNKQTLKTYNELSWEHYELRSKWSWSFGIKCFSITIPVVHMTCVTWHVNSVTNINALIRNYVFLLSDLSSLLSLSACYNAAGIWQLSLSACYSAPEIRQLSLSAYYNAAGIWPLSLSACYTAAGIWQLSLSACYSAAGIWQLSLLV